MAKDKETQAKTENQADQSKADQGTAAPASVDNRLTELEAREADLKAREAALLAREAELASSHDELTEFRQAKEAESKARENADVLKTVRVTARHLALRPKSLVKPNGDREPLSILVVQAKNDAHAKSLFIDQTARRLKDSNLAYADKYVKQFLDSAQDADYTFEYLDEQSQ